MRDLKIGDFNPGQDNPGRRAKIPILLLNATVLNDGHVWRFEAVRMGEPPRPRPASGIDMNLVLRRAPSYEDVVPIQQDFHLGVAVAASACFPAFLCRGYTRRNARTSSLATAPVRCQTSRTRQGA
jgi:hypothetical protein